MAELSEVVAREMAVKEDWIQLIHVAAHLHDIGKIGVPDYVLNKTGKLSNSEHTLMQSHPRIGCNIVEKIPNIMTSLNDYILHSSFYKQELSLDAWNVLSDKSLE